MRQFLIVSLFIVLLADLMLGFGLGFAPGLSLKNLFLYILFIALVVDVTIGGRDLLPEAWRVLGVWMALIGYAMFTWAAISLLGLLRGYSMVGGFISLKSQLVDFFLFFLLFMYAPRSLSQTIVLAKWLVIIFVFVNLITLLDVFNVPDIGIMADRRDSRVSGPIGSVNQYGAVLAFIVPLTTGLAIGSEKWPRVFYLFGATIGLILLGLTISRGAFVGVLAGIIITLYAVRGHYTRSDLMKGLGYTFLALLVVTAAVAIHDLDAFLTRFDMSEATTVRDMSSGRTEIWLKALTMMSYEPVSFITGYGWDSYRTLFLGYGDPHNEYLQSLFNLGLIGLSLIVFVFYWVFRQLINGVRSGNDEVKPLLIGFIVGWVSVLAAVFFVGLYLPWLFIWACAGTFCRLSIEVSRESNRE